MIDWAAVEIEDDHIAALRLLLQGRPEEWERLHNEKMTTDQDAAGYMQMFHAAFGVAVRRKFSPTYARLDIVQFVAKLRIESLERSDTDFNPRIAENAIRGSLGDPNLQEEDETRAIEDIQDVEHLIASQMAVLFDVLLTEEESGEGVVEQYVQEAAELARRWVREKQEAQAGERASAE